MSDKFGGACPNCGYSHEKGAKILKKSCYFCKKEICIICVEDHYKEEHNVVEKLKEAIRNLELDTYWSKQDLIPIHIIEENLSNSLEYDFEDSHLNDAIDELEDEGEIDKMEVIYWRD